MKSKLTKKIILDFLKMHKLMFVATQGEYPWIAAVFYTYDYDLNLYFLSSPETLHCKQIKQNNEVAVAIADSNQQLNDVKKGMEDLQKLITEVRQLN